MGDAKVMRLADGRLFVLDPKTNTHVEVPGANAMRDTPLSLDERIDLTMPIYDQALALNAVKPRERRRKA